MKTLLNKILFEKGNKLSGAIALSVVALIALGCTCNKSFDLLNSQANTNSSRTASNSSNSATEPTRSTSEGDLPSDSEIQALVKETTADFAEAIETNDFSELYSKSSSDFQSQFTEAKLRTAFKTFVDKKDVIVPILNKVPGTEADFSPSPSIRTEKGILKILVANGSFPTRPYPVKFEYEYIWRDDEWKLLAINVKM